MKRITLLFLLLLTISFTSVIYSQEQPAQEIIAQEEQPQIVITVTGSTIRIQDAPENSDMEVYNILGVKCMTEKIESSDCTVNHELPKGYYIVKIGSVVRKIIIK